MAEIARELGVTISLDDEVQEILSGRRAVGVRSRSGVHEADALVINADFARAMTRLVPDQLRRRWTDRKIARKKFSCSTFMLYLGIEGRYDDLAHHTIYLARTTSENLDEIESRHVLSEDPSFYVQNACVTDPALAPPGAAPFTCCSRDPPASQRRLGQEAPRFRELALAQLAQGRPGRRRARGFASSRWSHRPTGIAPSDPPRLDLQSGTQSCRRCSTFGRAIDSRTWNRSILSAAGRIPEWLAGHFRVGPDHLAADRRRSRAARSDRGRGVGIPPRASRNLTSAQHRTAT